MADYDDKSTLFGSKCNSGKNTNKWNCFCDLYLQVSLIKKIFYSFH